MKKIIIMVRGAEEHRAEIEELCRGKKNPVFLDWDADEEQFRSEATDAEAVLGGVDPDWLTGTEIRWMHLPFAGANRHAGRPGVRERILTNSSGAFGATIAEHCLGMLLAFARHLPAYIKQAEQGLWKDCGCEWGLMGRTALILGTGDLGTQTAIRLKAMGMHVIGCCRKNSLMREPYDAMHTVGELDRLLPEADAVFCCLPSTAETVGMLDARRLMLFRDDAILINVGRGDLIDTDALTALLRQGKFTGVGLDVTDPEPLPKDNPLWDCKSVLITPHVAGWWHLQETFNRVVRIFGNNLKHFVNGEPFDNVVNRTLGY